MAPQGVPVRADLTVELRQTTATSAIEELVSQISASLRREPPPTFSTRLVIECLGWAALTRLSIHYIRRLSSAS